MNWHDHSGPWLRVILSGSLDWLPHYCLWRLSSVDTINQKSQVQITLLPQIYQKVLGKPLSSLLASHLQYRDNNSELLYHFTATRLDIWHILNVKNCCTNIRIYYRNGWGGDNTRWNLQQHPLTLRRFGQSPWAYFEGLVLIQCIVSHSFIWCHNVTLKQPQISKWNSLPH